jgi:hypothetical protein
MSYANYSQLSIKKKYYSLKKMDTLNFHDTCALGHSINEDDLIFCILQGVIRGLYVLHIPNISKVLTNRIESYDAVCTPLLQRYPTKIFSHFESNLCGSKQFLAWCGNRFQDEETTQMLRSLELSLHILTKLDGRIIIELGRNVDKVNGLLTTAKSIHKTFLPESSSLLLQNSLNLRSNIGVTFTDMITVYQNIPSQKQIGFCIHIPYLFCNGLYTMDQSVALIQDFKKMSGTFPVVVIIGDSTTPYGSKQYISCTIGEGNMWSGHQLADCIEFCEQNAIIMLVDTSRNYFILKNIMHYNK